MSDDADADDLTRLAFAATPLAVRQALAQARSCWACAGLIDDVCRIGEQVLAEVLNNVIEHAQAGMSDGQVRLETGRAGRGIVCRVQDNGTGLPGGQLPPGDLAEFCDAADDLPEGGFGWFMIRSMTSALTYTRSDGWNRLEFHIADNNDR